MLGGPVANDAAHDCVSALHVKRDDVGCCTAQDWKIVTASQFESWGWRGTYAHALGLAGKGEGGEDVESTIAAAEAYLQSWWVHKGTWN